MIEVGTAIWHVAVDWRDRTLHLWGDRWGVVYRITPPDTAAGARYGNVEAFAQTVWLRAKLNNVGDGDDLVQSLTALVDLARVAHTEWCLLRQADVAQ